MNPPPPPSLDTWTSIFLIIAAQGFFTGIILWLNRRGDRAANRFLAGILLLFSLSMVEYVLFWTRYAPQFPAFGNISVSFPFLYGVFLYFYFRQLLVKTPFRWVDLLHFLPFLMDFIFWLPFYLTRGAERFEVIKAIPIWYGNLIWLKIAHKLFYAYLSWRVVNDFGGLTVIKKWGRRVILFFVAFVLVFISYFILVKMPFFNPNWDYAISFAMTAFIGLVAVYGYIQPEVFQGLPFQISNFKFQILGASNSEMLTPNFEKLPSNSEILNQKSEILPPLSKKYQNSALTHAAAETLVQHLDELMQKEKLYADNELRLEKLADKLGVNKHHVSQVINEKKGCNFFDYVNQLRIEEAKRLLLETDKTEMNIIEIAYAVGFNNKVSFNTTFKNKTGMTPTAFREQKSLV